MHGTKSNDRCFYNTQEYYICLNELGGKMQIERENAKNEQYIFQYNNGSFSEVVTYKKHLINKIKSDPNAQKNAEIQAFSSENVTCEKLETFIRIAKAAGYTIYKVTKL